ncbi:MAG: XisI protein [Saprospiraceae bacterium]|nr:XisI protein [Saprospiraceae bacterium]
MEKIIAYKKIAKDMIADFEGRKNKSNRAIRYQVIADDATGNYLLLRNGWKGAVRFYNVLVHIEVTAEGLVWLHQDSTDLIIADKLLEAGIPEANMVLGFHAPIMRADTSFAVGEEEWGQAISTFQE